MSARKSRFINKILTGLVTTVVAPVLASVVSQQMDGWQQTLKVLVEKELPAAKPNWNQPAPESVGVGRNRLTAENAEYGKTRLQGFPPRSPR